MAVDGLADPQRDEVEAIGVIPVMLPAVEGQMARPIAIAGRGSAQLSHGIPSSMTAAVESIGPSGVAVLNGLVIMGAILKRPDDGENEDKAIINGAMERGRPVQMTTMVASLGLAPTALATGIGSKAQRPPAMVVIVASSIFRHRPRTYF